MKRHLLQSGLAGLGFIAACTATCRASDITVRLLSAKDGRPLVERHIELSIDRIVKLPDQSSPLVFQKWEYTGADGTAVFHVNIPLPPHSQVGIFGDVPNSCSPGDYEVEEVLRTGFAVKVVRNCPHRPIKKFVVSPHPGEIVIFSGEYSRWERTLYFPWAS